MPGTGTPPMMGRVPGRPGLRARPAEFPGAHVPPSVHYSSRNGGVRSDAASDRTAARLPDALQAQATRQLQAPRKVALCNILLYLCWIAPGDRIVWM